MPVPRVRTTLPVHVKKERGQPLVDVGPAAATKERSWRLGGMAGRARERRDRWTLWDRWLRVSGAMLAMLLFAVACDTQDAPLPVIRVGHASPHCRFSAVEVFGGEA